jgi:hypothetical protein
VPLINFPRSRFSRGDSLPGSQDDHSLPATTPLLLDTAVLKSPSLIKQPDDDASPAALHRLDERRRVHAMETAQFMPHAPAPDQPRWRMPELREHGVGFSDSSRSGLS